MNPSSVQARKMVLVSAFGLLAIGAYRSRQPDQDVNLARRVWGVGVVGLMLSILADFAPTIAGPFAVLTVLGSLSNGGDAAIQNLLGNLGKASSSASTVHTTGSGGTTTSGPVNRIGGQQASSSASTVHTTGSGGTTTSGPVNRIGGQQ